MNADEILSDVQLIDLDHRDAQFVRAELYEKIGAAIAAAELGSITSERKSAASRANGAKGGRPRKEQRDD